MFQDLTQKLFRCETRHSVRQRNGRFADRDDGARFEAGDEVIVPSFTYVATAEVIALLKLQPVMVEVDEDTFNVTAEIIEKAITPKTKAIVPVHLFGQSAICRRLWTLPKNTICSLSKTMLRQSARIIFLGRQREKTGTIGHIGCTSFFPSKNLGCYGDGGAIFTDDDELASKDSDDRQSRTGEKYYHSVIGVNSRLDSIQAAILDVKLKYLDEYCAAR